jgi:hypothetical protein
MKKTYCTMLSLALLGTIFSIGITINATPTDWGTDTRLTYSNGDSKYPRVLMDSTETIYVFWQDDRDGNHNIFLKKSSDYGVTWTSDIKVTDTPLQSGWPRVAIDSTDVLHLLWLEEDESNPTYSFHPFDNDPKQILYKNSADGGISWSSPLTITTNTGQMQYCGLDICIGQSDTVHVSYSKYSPSKVYHRKSTDGGTTWSSPVVIGSDIDAARPTVITADNHGHVYVAFHTWGNTGDIDFVKSDDNGITWGSAFTLLGGYGWPSRAHLTCLDDGHVFLTYVSNRYGSDQWTDHREVYIIISSDYASTWGSEIRITHTGFRMEHPISVIDQDNNINIVWQDLRQGNWEIYYSKLDINGNTLDDDTRLTNDTAVSGHPKVLIDSTGTRQVYWHDNRVADDNYEIFTKGDAPEFEPPVADAGPDQTVYEGDVVHFNGSGSTATGRAVYDILHVSVWQHDELQKIIDYTDLTDNFSVTQVALSQFNSGLPGDLSSFDAIVFGLNNGYEMNAAPIERTVDLRNYVSAGGGIVWTHDSLELTWDYGTDLEGPAGLNYDDNLTQLVGLSNRDIEIVLEHEILHNPFNIGNVGDFIPKTPYPPPWYHYAHTTFGIVTTADIIIQHKTTPAPTNYYLTTHEYGEGRVVVDEIGHTVVSEEGTFLGIPSLKECQILVNSIHWAAGGRETSGIISYEWDFDAHVDTDGDGDPTNDVDAVGPTPTHIYGDNGIYTVTLKVKDNQNLSDTDTCNVTVLNVDPVATIESIEMNVEIGLRVAGRKYNDVGMTIYEDGVPLGYLSIERLPGSPDEQMAEIPVSIDFSKYYSAVVTYIPEDPPNIGSNPVWIYLKSVNGSIKKIHHTFNFQQSMKRNSDHWNHVEPWEVDFSDHLIGLPFEITSHVTDPGSDDETLIYSYGSQIVTKTYLNNPPNPDPYPSPEVNPVDLMDITILSFEGPGTLSLQVDDDDGGFNTTTLILG